MIKLKYRYFTLIELIIVISIIMILASLLLPALQSAKKATNRIACLSNMKQLGISFLQYTSEQNDFFPPYDLNNFSGGAITKFFWSWGLMMHNDEYIKNNKIFQCPSIKTYFTYDHSNGPDDVVNNPSLKSAYLYIGYGYNNWYLGSRWGVLKASAGTAARSVPARAIEIKNPSGCLVLAETTQSCADDTIGGCYITYSTGLYISTIHSGGCNVLWVDGHTSFMKDSKNNLNGDLNDDKYYDWN